ncbi:MAG: SDR family NAD(P)-dependent oxidoreductase [Candidatus Binatia bacterium]
MSSAMSLAGRHAVVTGGASGIGRCTALALAAAGADVAVLDLNAEGAAGVAGEVRGRGRRAAACAVDVASWASVEAAVERVRADLGPAHVLVNCAGIAGFLPLMQMGEAEWDRMIAVHLKGTFNCTRLFVPDMIAAGWGRVVSVTSVAGLNGGGPGLAHYAAAKGGIVGFTKALAQELGPMGVTVNAVAPGLIDTPLIRTAGAPADLYDSIARRTPVRRLGLPEDVAAAIAFLASPEASFTTGQILSPNGGVYT